MRIAFQFQTPCGDVGVSGRIRGGTHGRHRAVRFRPLAGMSVFPGCIGAWSPR